jgi:hypothetical protein
MFGDWPVELNHVVAGDLLEALWRASALDVGATCEHCPPHFRDLARHQGFVLRVRGPERDVGFTLGEIEDLIDHDHFDAQSGIAGVKCLEDRRLHDPVTGRLRTCHANGADELDVA